MRHGRFARGGLWLAIYKRSLGGVLLVSVRGIVRRARDRRDPWRTTRRSAITAARRYRSRGYLLTSRFWFESFQNWQSEFFSVGVLVLLSIWLRQQGSAQSKPVAAPSRDTGE